ncbi:RING finger protein Etp1p [[Candida] anglica]|uniref:RING finger protein Etp1p n=1 Tax=[Candida] anglica TaxID=148631 RepID=A0ABP0ECE3_9ASCO
MLGTENYRVYIELRQQSPLNKSTSNTFHDYRTSPIEVTDIPNPSAINMGHSSEPIKAVSLGEGTIRLYREFEPEDDELSRSEPLSAQVIPGDDTMVCIVAVPTYFTATDLLGYIGNTYIDSITHIRILKSDKPNRFLVLIKFKDILKTAQFQKAFNGRAFNSMEPETCHVVFVKSVSIDQEAVYNQEDELIPFLLNDPFTTKEHIPIDKEIESQRLVELPTCPVCLERMDSSVTGLLTIPCQHTFHCQCLTKWKDDTCPICRYSINVSNQKVRRSVRRLSFFRRPSSTGNFSVVGDGSGGSNASGATLSSIAATIPTSTVASEHCSECTISEKLWICLICGNLGCDRYAPQHHSLNHFVSTGHCFAMELDTSRVWDYAGDNYVHRLIANESDGKLVELPEKTTASFSNPGQGMGIFDGFGSNTNGPSNINNSKLGTNSYEINGNSGNFDKVDEVGFEYSQLLISQLASQREYYEDLLQEGAASKSRRGSSKPDLESKVEELAEKLKSLTEISIPKLEKKLKEKDERISILSRELNDSNTLNEALSDKIDFLTNSNKEMQTQNDDLSEQVKDLMFFLETQEKFKDKSDADKEGQVIMHKPSSSSKSRRKGKK